MSMQGGQPIIILKEGTERTRGKDAQRNNIMAAKVIAEAVKSTLGPRGMDKLLVDSLGDVLITNDGASILDELEVNHPAAKMLIQVAKTQDDEVGDGTTTAVVLAGELLTKAEGLLDKKIHPSQIIDGYRLAAAEAQKILSELAMNAKKDDIEILTRIAQTALNSKSVSSARGLIAKIAVDAVLRIRDDKNGDSVADLDYIKILQKQGLSLSDTELIEGVIIDKEIVHSGMPKSVENAKIALINKNLEIEKGEFDAEIRIADPTQIQAFLDDEERMLTDMVDKIAASGANVIICQKGIDDLVQHFLSKKGIIAIRRVKKSDMEKLARATGGNITTSLDDLSATDLGEVGHVYERKIGDDEHVFITKCKNPKSVTILIRGGSKYITDEAERAIVDALSVVRDVVEDGKYVAGGGSPETELARRISLFASSIEGKKQLAASAFAEALKVVPITLAENAGLDPIEIMNKVVSAHADKANEHSHLVGVNVLTGEVEDMNALGVIEPLRVKKQAIRSAAETSVMILRIDDVMTIKSSGGDAPPGGMPPGMGGMGGMPPGMGGMGGMPPGMGM